MPDRDTLLSMAERCEKATGPDRRLEIDIFTALGLGVRIPGSEPGGSQDGWHNPDNDPRAAAAWNCTGSIDAAMSLVPEGWLFNIEPIAMLDKWRANIWHPLAPDSDPEYPGKARTPSLALCAASLRARVNTRGED